MAALGLPAQDGGDVPEWVHLLPASSGAVQTGDARGPYNVKDADRLIQLSFSDVDRLPIDENHSTDLAAPLGNPSPARGWVVEMQARKDGIWGRVEWSAAGQALLHERAYRALSPVILHDKAGNIMRILRASLVNRPNLRGLTALNQQEEDSMSLLERLAELLGLTDASEDAVIEAVKAKLEGESGDDDVPELQSQLANIGVALGLGKDADAGAVLNAATAATQGDQDGDVIVALQAELATVTNSMNALTEDIGRKAAEAFVDGAIRDGRVGVKPLRDRYIAMHMRDAAEVEAIIAGMPAIGGTTTTTVTPPEMKDGKIALNAQQRDAARLIGVTPEAYAKTLKAEHAKEGAI